MDVIREIGAGTGPGRPASRPRLTAALAAAVFAVPSMAGYTVVQEQALRIEVTPLIVERGGTRSLDALAVEATRDRAGVLDASLPWSTSGPALGLHLEIGVGEGDGDREHELRLSASVRLGASPPRRSSRDLTLSEGSTGLFDVVQEGDRSLVLSIRVEPVLRPVVPGPRKVGAPVLFALAIERREGERSVPLETNRLVTFLREGVEYSFSRGEGDARESLRLLLTPLRLEGDIAEIEVDVSGSLPAAAGPLVLSRRERMLVSRKATSTLEVTAGEPPAGYRFRITPDF